jgi:NAD(P)-dependent dehydrogenase (short-subunit alcohol dehydrogenase family)
MNTETDTSSKRIALVTGASRGIGRAAAVALAKAGHHVIITARTVGALEELDDEIQREGGTASILPLNLEEGEKVDALGPTLFKRWQHLDVLVAAAGVLGRITPLAHMPDKEWDNLISVNLVANWRLIRSLDPLLRRSDAGRAIFLTADVARNICAYWGPYAITKSGLETMVKTYAEELATTSARANLLDPGATRTGLRAAAFPGENPLTVKLPSELAPYIVELASPECTKNGETVVVA